MSQKKKKKNKCGFKYLKKSFEQRGKMKKIKNVGGFSDQDY